MIIPVANKCLQCMRIFCCPTCRQKHELKEHVAPAESSNPAPHPPSATLSCALCNDQPFRLQTAHSAELLAHIVATHLPLQCSRCTTLFSSATDLRSDSSCCQGYQQPSDPAAASRRPQIPPLTDKYGRILKMPTTQPKADGQPGTANCSLKSIASTATYVNQPQQMGATELGGTSTVTTVAAADLSHASTGDHLTPITQWNMRWRLKLGGVSGGAASGGSAANSAAGLSGSAANASSTGGGGYTDSISSIRNVSSMLNNTPSMLLSHSENSPTMGQQLGGGTQSQPRSQHHLAAHPHRHHQQKHPALKRQTSTPMHHQGGMHHQQQQPPHHHHHPSQHYPYYSGSSALPNPTNSNSTINHLAPKRAHSFESLSSSSCQMSSIGGHNFSSDSDMSPPVCSSSRVAHAAKPATVAANQSQRPRHKLPPSATPLRQVMSRSIQKAIVQHGMSKFVMTNHGRYSPAAAAAAGHIPPPSPAAAPLDLRTSPAIRRSFETASSDGDSSGSSAGSSVASISPPQSQRHLGHDRRRILGTESSIDRVESIAEVDVNNNVDSVYESCKSYDVANDTASIQPAMLDAVATAAVTLQQTPKILGLAMRANSFAERRAAPRPSCYEPRPLEDEDEETESTQKSKEPEQVEPVVVAEVSKVVLEETMANGEPDEEDEADVWYTPPVKLHKAASCPAWKIPAFTLADLPPPNDDGRAPNETAKLFRLPSQRSSESDDNVFSSTKRSDKPGTPPRSDRKSRINSARIESFYSRERSTNKSYGIKKRRPLVRTPVLKKLKSKVIESGASGIWSKVATGLMRLASFGQTVDEVASPPALIQPAWNDFKSPRPIDATQCGLLKKCATFGGVSLAQTASADGRRKDDDGMLQSLALCGKRRRTLTSSQSSLSPNQTGRLPAHRISGRPPLKRMRRIGGSLVSPI